MAFDPDAYLAKEDKKKGFDPDAYLAKTKPETALQTFGRSTASLADTALNALTGTLDVAAYPLARAFGRSPAQAQAETTSPKDVIGRAFGVTGTPGYEQAPLRQLGTYAGEVLGENVIQPLAQSTGLPEQDVASMVNTGMIAAGPATGRAVKNIAQVPVDVARGAAGRATGYIAEPGVKPTGYQVPSSRILMGDEFIPKKEMAELQRGMPISEGAIRPIRELAPAPILALSGGEIPVAGQAARAFGERIGKTYSNPYTAAADIGSMFLTGGIPVLTAGRGALGLAQAGADAYLGRKGFTSLTPEQTAALSQGINPFAPTTGPVRPTTPQAMAAQQINPAMATTPAAQAALATTQAKAQTIPPTRQLGYTPPRAPTMYVAPEGVAGTNLPQVEKAALQQRYAPQPVAQPAAQSASLFEAPLTTPEVTAAPKPLQVKATEGKTAEQLASEQALLDLINKKAGRTTTPATPAVAVTEMPKASEIRGQLKLTAAGGIRGKDGIVQVNRTLFNDIAEKNGFDPIKWDTAPDVSKMGVADARKTIADFVDDQFKDQYTKGTRTSQTKIIKEAEAGKTAEQLAQEEAAALARVAKFANPSNPLSKTIKGSGGRGTMGLMTEPLKMITDKPAVVDKINNTPWLSRTDFEQAVFMNELGLNAGGEFIAKMKAPEGSIIRAVDATTDSSAYQFNNGEGFLVRKSINSPITDYTIYNPDGTRYEITRYDNSITNVELYLNDNKIAEYSGLPNKKGNWWVVEQGKDGSYSMVHESDKKLGNARTKELFKELPKEDYNAIVNEQLARAQALKQGK